MNTRWAAVNAIGEIGGAKATKLLGEILKTGDRQSATAAAAALAQHRRHGGARAADRGRALRPRADHRRARAARPDGGRRRRPGAAQRDQAGHERRAPRRAAAPAQDRQPRRAAARDRPRAQGLAQRALRGDAHARRRRLAARRSTRSSTSPASRAARPASARSTCSRSRARATRPWRQLLSDSLFSRPPRRGAATPRACSAGSAPRTRARR